MAAPTADDLRIAWGPLAAGNPALLRAAYLQARRIMALLDHAPDAYGPMLEQQSHQTGLELVGFVVPALDPNADISYVLAVAPGSDGTGVVISFNGQACTYPSWPASQQLAFNLTGGSATFSVGASPPFPITVPVTAPTSTTTSTTTTTTAAPSQERQVSFALDNYLFLTGDEVALLAGDDTVLIDYQVVPDAERQKGSHLFTLTLGMTDPLPFVKAAVRRGSTVVTGPVVPVTGTPLVENRPPAPGPLETPLIVQTGPVQTVPVPATTTTTTTTTLAPTTTTTTTTLPPVPTPVQDALVLHSGASYVRSACQATLLAVAGLMPIEALDHMASTCFDATHPLGFYAMQSFVDQVLLAEGVANLPIPGLCPQVDQPWNMRLDSLLSAQTLDPLTGTPDVTTFLSMGTVVSLVATYSRMPYLQKQGGDVLTDTLVRSEVLRQAAVDYAEQIETREDRFDPALAPSLDREVGQARGTGLFWRQMVDWLSATFTNLGRASDLQDLMNQISTQLQQVLANA